MNERIRQLAEQATSFDFGGERGFDGVNPREFFDKEKFAELIVRECAKVAFNFSPSAPAAFDIHRAVIKHFGVEE